MYSKTMIHPTGQYGWREAICGSIAFFNHDGERLHTIYCAATTEYGKEKFKEKFSSEIERVKENLPDVLYVGVADGTKDNWIFLKKYTQREILDFYHAREYISRAASPIFGRDKKAGTPGLMTGATDRKRNREQWDDFSRNWTFKERISTARISLNVMRKFVQNKYHPGLMLCATSAIWNNT